MQMEFNVSVDGDYEIEGAEWAREMWESCLPRLDSVIITTAGDPEHVTIDEILNQIASEAEADAIRYAEKTPKFAEAVEKANEYGREQELGGVRIVPRSVKITVNWID